VVARTQLPTGCNWAGPPILLSGGLNEPNSHEAVGDGNHNSAFVLQLATRRGVQAGVTQTCANLWAHWGGNS
jgi:hypothetical protein